MPRGRPRKVVVEPLAPDSIELEVASVLSKVCGIPGCAPRLHLEEAKQITIIMKRKYNIE
jgi:hypothetical protein